MKEIEKKKMSADGGGGKNQQRLNVFAVVVVAVVVVIGLAYLIVAGWASWSAAARHKSCFVGSSLLVYPGPGDTSPGAYWEGAITFDTVDHAIDWKIRYGGLGPVIGMDILGPIASNASPQTDTPVYLTLCGPPSLVMCVSPEGHLLRQKIKQSSPQNQPLNSYIEDITDNRDEYLIRLRTGDHPSGALVARLNSAC